MTTHSVGRARSRLAATTTVITEGRGATRLAHGSDLPPAAHENLRAQVVRPTGSPGIAPGRTEPVTVEAAFTVWVAVADAGSLTTPAGDGEPSDGRFMDIAGGDVLLVPHGAGASRTDGDVMVIRCRPTVAAVPRHVRTG